MAFFAWFIRSALPVLLVLGSSGCLPSGHGRSDEEKEPRYRAGKSCINSMDFRGAIEEFEKALEVNPRSAAAHYQLGWLYEQKEPDPAAAIFHYERFLRLRPNADNAEWIKQRINNCKQDLAKTVLPLPITPGMQRQFEQYADELKRLREENEWWRAHYAAQSQDPGGSASLPAPSGSVAAGPSPLPARVVPAAEPSTLERQPVSTRAHTVQDGETLYSIARRYGIRLDALRAANPGLDPRRLRVGQTLNIPSP